jgi:hypothetical protein
MALAVYVEALMWPDAMRFAKRHLPHKLSEVNMAHQKLIFSGGPKSKAELLEACEMWVQCQQYVQAIDAYLSITQEHLTDVRSHVHGGYYVIVTYTGLKYHAWLVLSSSCRTHPVWKKCGALRST